MMKRLLTITLIILGLSGPLLWAGATPAKAQWCDACDLTGATSHCTTDYGGRTSCYCTGGSGGCGASCGSGEYPCQRAGGCCPVGDGGSGGGGGGTTAEGCPAGTHLDWSQAYTYCGPDGRPGERATGNCCKYSKIGSWPNVEDFCYRYNYEMQAAPCVSDCNANAWGACSTSCGAGTQYNACGTPRSCQVNDPNVWGGWGACSAFCGGGTQSRVNQCGTSQSQACNPQACTWWQVKDADVATNSDLRSQIPAGNYFGLIGAGGFPGIPAYGGGTNLTPSNVSVTAQMANTTAIGAKVYSYTYFANLVPATTVINTVSTNTFDQSAVNSGTIDPETGYYWYKYDGALNSNLALTISALNMGSRKLVLMVDNADLDITGNINLTKGTGFFLTIVKGTIVVAPGVGGAGPNLEGLYLTDGTFSDGAGTSQLWVRGSVATYGGTTLQRDLGGTANTTPAELFEFAPDQLLLFPKVLGTRKIKWKEVAP